MSSTFRLVSVLMLAIAASFPLRAAEPTPAPTGRTYVLVHGASGGGWDWRKVDRLLTADGHTAHRVTLTGLGEKVHLASPEINLTTHINDVVNVILFENLHNVVLVGHSYGGMVITGVMDRIPERLSHVVFLDAAVPDDGMSSESMRGTQAAPRKVVDGLVHFDWLDASKPFPRDVPQSYKTFTEPVSYKNPAAKALPVTYIPFIADGQTVEQRSNSANWQRAKSRGWTVRTLASDHNAQRSHPKELVALLEDAPNDRNK